MASKKKQATPNQPWWQETSERHAKLEDRFRWSIVKLNTTDPDNTFNPSLVTGRCRCKACRAAREAGFGRLKT